jgi:hypothetical protein
MIKYLIPLTLVLAACETGPRTTPEPVIQIQRVEVPVPVPCGAREAVGPRRSFPDSDQALRNARNLAERVALLLAGRELREDRVETLETAIDTCSVSTSEPSQ